MNETVAIDRAHADAAIGELDHGLSVVSIAKSYDKKAVLPISLVVDRGRCCPALPQRLRQTPSSIRSWASPP